MSAKATSTNSKYSSSWESWRSWAESRANIVTIPANPLHVALFLTELYLDCVRKGCGPSIIESTVYAIRWAHCAAGLPPPTDHQIVKFCLEGAKRKLGRPLNPKEPISLDLVKRLCEHYIKSSTLASLRFLVILLLGYAGFLRVDELKSHRCKDISIQDDYMSVNIPKRKNDQYREGHTILIAKSGKATCPVSVVCRLLENLNGSRGDTPLIRRIVKTKSNERFHPTYGISITRIREEFKSHVKPFVDDISRYSLHSIKSGAASNAGCRLLNSDLLDRHAGWRCQTSKNRYIKFSSNDLLEVSRALNI